MTGPIITPGDAANAGDISQTFAGSPLGTGVTGGVYVAKFGTPVPAGATRFDDLDETLFKNVGFVSEDGITGTEDRSTTDITAWGGEIVAVLQESFSVSWQFKLLQFMNETAARLAYGDANVEFTAADDQHGNWLAIKQNAKLLPKQVIVVDSFYGDDLKRMRMVAPIAQVTEKGDFNVVHNDLTGHDLTVRLFPDKQGNSAYIYTDDGLAVPLSGS